MAPSQKRPTHRMGRQTSEAEPLVKIETAFAVAAAVGALPPQTLLLISELLHEFLDLSE